MQKGDRKGGDKVEEDGIGDEEVSKGWREEEDDDAEMTGLAAGVSSFRVATRPVPVLLLEVVDDIVKARVMVGEEEEEEDKMDGDNDRFSSSFSTVISLFVFQVFPRIRCVLRMLYK
jgi:hypothetical protein